MDGRRNHSYKNYSSSNQQPKQFNKEAYDPSWGAFQRYPTPKAISERARRAEEAEGYRQLNAAIGGPSRSYIETNKAAVKTIKELESKEVSLRNSLNQEREKNKSHLMNIYSLKCSRK